MTKRPKSSKTVGGADFNPVCGTVALFGYGNLWWFMDNFIYSCIAAAPPPEMAQLCVAGGVVPLPCPTANRTVRRVCSVTGTVLASYRRPTPSPASAITTVCQRIHKQNKPINYHSHVQGSNFQPTVNLPRPNQTTRLSFPTQVQILKMQVSSTCSKLTLYQPFVSLLQTSLNQPQTSFLSMTRSTREIYCKPRG